MVRQPRTVPSRRAPFTFGLLQTNNGPQLPSLPVMVPVVRKVSRPLLFLMKALNANRELVGVTLRMSGPPWCSVRVLRLVLGLFLVLVAGPSRCLRLLCETAARPAMGVRVVGVGPVRGTRVGTEMAGADVGVAVVGTGRVGCGRVTVVGVSMSDVIVSFSPRLIVSRTGRNVVCLTVFSTRLVPSLMPSCMNLSPVETANALLASLTVL